MSDVREWIEERRAIHAAAPGKWKKYLATHSSGGVIVEDENEEMLFYDAGFGVTVAEPDNAIAIVDAHNMFPRALDALNAVLELHWKDDETGYCNECTEDFSMSYASWPCLTVQRIKTALEAAND